VLVHLAGGVVGVRRNPEVLGIQGKRKTYRRKVGPGIGTGGFMKLGYPAYTYEGVESGFAESDLDEYDKVAERVAWSRSLATIRKGFIADKWTYRWPELELHDVADLRFYVVG